MEVKKYTVSDLRRFIKESANEFKPVMGKDVAKDNQKNNEKAYKDMEKEAKSPTITVIPSQWSHWRGNLPVTPFSHAHCARRLPRRCAPRNDMVFAISGKQ